LRLRKTLIGNKRKLNFYPSAGVRHAIATEFGLLIEEVRAIFAPLTFSDSINSLAVSGR